MLVDARITNAVRCVPPENKPTPAEIKTCRSFLAATIAEMRNLRAIVTLGRISHESTLAALGRRARRAPFRHGASDEIGALRLFVSYHCSRYNTNTGVLTPEMFRDVFAAVRAYLDAGASLHADCTLARYRSQPGNHLGGVLVRREHRIENLGNHARRRSPAPCA